MSALKLGSRSRFAGFLMLLAMLVSALPSAVAGDQDFTLVNQTGVDIYQVFIAPSSLRNWQEDILGIDVLADGDAVAIEFDRDEDAELWDLQVTDSEGNGIVWTQIDLMSISLLTLYYDNGRAWAEAE